MFSPATNSVSARVAKLAVVKKWLCLNILQLTMRRDGLIEQGFLTEENSLARFDNFPSYDPVAPGLAAPPTNFLLST
jgi:hypothetical protein